MADWIVPLSMHSNPQIQVICFPFAGGGTKPYRNWASKLDETAALSAILLPGRETRIGEPPSHDIDEVCDGIVKELLRKHWKEKVIFFGHSMGTLLAFEVAKRIKERFNWELEALFVSGRQALHSNLGGEFHLQSDEVFLSEIRRLGATPESVLADDEMRQLILPMLRADYHLLETYHPGASVKLSCPLITCTGKNDTEVTPRQIQEWAFFSSESCEHHKFNGDHFYLFDENNKDALIGFINRQIRTSLIGTRHSNLEYSC